MKDSYSSQIKRVHESHLTAEKLIEVLKTMNKDAVVVINGKIPSGIIPLNGKIAIGYFGPVFKENPKGDPSVRYQAVTFTHWMELSDGTVEETHLW